MIGISASTMLGYNEFAYAFTPTNIEEIKYVQIQSGEFRELTAYQLSNLTTYEYYYKFPKSGDDDSLYMDESTLQIYTWSDGSYQMVYDLGYDIPEAWDWNTLMYAQYFNETTAAGNVDWTLETVNHMLIKRKLDSNYKWTTIYEKDINTYDDFDITFVDPTPSNGTWQYAVVPILNKTEGPYSWVSVDVEIDKLVIIDADETHSTLFANGDISLTCLDNPEIYSTMYNKYPTVVYNSDANYKQISLSAKWYPESDCVLDCIYDDTTRTKYLNEILTFLCNRKAKIIKYVDGQRFLAQITTLPTAETGESYQILNIQFDATEIGDPDSESALYYGGFIDVTSEWWSS